MLIMLTELQFKMIHHFAGMYLFCDFLYYSFCTLSYNKTQIVQERKKYVQRLNIQRCRKDSNTSKAKNSEYNFFFVLITFQRMTALCALYKWRPLRNSYETHMYKWRNSHVRPLRNSHVRPLRNSHVQVTALTKLSSFLNDEAESRYLVDRWAVWHEAGLLWPPVATYSWERATE